MCWPCGFIKATLWLHRVSNIILPIGVNSILLHSLSVTWMSSAVLNWVTQTVRNFLRSNSSRSKGFHLIAWDKVILPKQDGGLGIKDLSLMNLTL